MLGEERHAAGHCDPAGARLGGVERLLLCNSCSPGDRQRLLVVVLEASSSHVADTDDCIVSIPGSDVESLFGEFFGRYSARGGIFRRVSS